MASLEEIRNTRLEKLKKLEDKGINAYPASVRFDYEIASLRDNFDKLSKSKKG